MYSLIQWILGVKHFSFSVKPWKKILLIVKLCPLSIYISFNKSIFHTILHDHIPQPLIFAFKILYFCSFFFPEILLAFLVLTTNLHLSIYYFFPLIELLGCCQKGNCFAVVLSSRSHFLCFTSISFRTILRTSIFFLLRLLSVSSSTSFGQICVCSNWAFFFGC